MPSTDSGRRFGTLPNSPFARLLSADGQIALREAIARVRDESSRLTAIQALRKTVAADLAALAVETALLRKRATSKFPHAEKMYFTREALEQASGWAVAQYRAKRYAGYPRILDLGCGIGGDALAMAEAGCHVIAIDRDPERAAMCEANAVALGLRLDIRCADILTMPLPEVDAVFCDPARRVAGRRVLSPFDSEPSIHAVISRFPTGFPIGFKLAPGMDPAEIELLGGEIEFLSADGELKECVLWMGSLKTAARRATILKSVPIEQTAKV